MPKRNVPILIIIPTYNRATTIGKTIDSFIAQDYKDWELLVVDDNSIDNTHEMIELYHQRDARIHYLLNERKKGAQGARNTGILHAKTEWIICFDSDNEAHPDMLEKLIAMISDNVDVVSCFSNVIDEKTKQQIGKFEWVSEGDIHRNLFAGSSYVDFNQAIMRKSKLLEIGLLDEDCPSMQEWDTHIRLSKIAHYTTVREPLVDYYVNGADAISTDTRREVKGCFYVFRKHREEWRKDKKAVGFFVTNTYTMIRKNSNIWFRIVSVVKLIGMAPQAISHIIEYRWQYIKRKVKRF